MRPALIVCLFGLLASCTTVDAPRADAAPISDAQLPPIPFGTIEATAAGVCFAQAAPKTQTRIITEQIEIVPAVLGPDGDVLTPPVYRDQSRPATEVVQPGERFEAVCPADFTPDRVRTLQRALMARQAYAGPITGVMDAPTGAAIRQFQAAQGLDSPNLKREIAERLGIVPVTVLSAQLPEV